MTLNYNRNANLQSGLPQMNEPIEGWQITIQLIRVIQSIVDGDKVEKLVTINFRGTVQPLSAEQLQFKPENLRSWRWLWIHAVAGTLNLETGDKIIFNNIRYKVMAVKDYSLYAYIEYELCEDFEDNDAN